MKIAFLTPEYPNSSIGSCGGIGTSIKNLAMALNHLGYAVRILVYCQIVDDEFEEDGITIQKIKNIKIKGLSWYLTRKKIQNIINSLYINNKIDILEVSDWTGISSFIKPKQCPVIIKLHGSDTYFCHLDNRPVKWWNKFHEKRAIINANGHISVSQFTADLTNKLFNQAINYKIIPNGIETNLFKGKSKRRNDSKVVLYFGTLIRKKGVLELPFIFNLVSNKRPGAKLILVGGDSGDIITGNDSTWSLMEDLFSIDSFRNVDYIGKVPYEEIKEHISNSDVCVFPSFAEAFPVSWLESMSMGKAIVASNIGWANEMIEDGKEGFLRDPRNHELFANAICELLSNENLSLNFGFNAREKAVQCYDSQEIAKLSIQFYESVLNDKF